MTISLDPQPTTPAPKTIPAASVAPNFPARPLPGDTQLMSAGGDQTTEGQTYGDTQDLPALGSNFPDSQARRDTQMRIAVGDQTPTPSHTAREAQGMAAGCGPILASAILGMTADVVGDLEAVRVANENRYRTLTATDEYGHGLTPDHPDIARLAALVDALKATEHQSILNLQRVMRKHPLGPWVKNAPGVGEKQAARLLAVIRDPYWNDLHNRPRTVSELWAYCGLHVIQTPGAHHGTATQSAGGAGSNVHPDSHPTGDNHGRPAVGVAPKRQRGQKSNWSEDARQRAWLIAASCVKQPADTRYRQVYDTTRLKYANTFHNSVCVRCGPKNKPAQPGSPLSLGHQHARALRAIAKTVLKDLWIESKRIHDEETR